MDAFAPDDPKVRALRELLPATGAGIVLDLPTAGLLPAETDRALREADDWELRVGRGGPDHQADAELRRDEARGVLAAVLGVGPDDVLPVMGIGAALSAALLALEPGQPSLALEPGLDPIVDAAARRVAVGRGWREETTQAGVGVVLTPAIRAHDGTRVDLHAVRARLGPTSIVVADLTHAVGAVGLGEPSWDVAIMGTDRWLLAPDGGAAIVRAPGGRVPAPLTCTVDPLPRRAALGLARSAGWLLMYVGLPWATARTARLSGRLRRGLAAIHGVQLYGSLDEASPVVVFTLHGWSAQEAADELGRRVFAITGRTPDGHALRLGVGAWTTEDELDRFTSAVAELAAHTPMTLPRRPALTVLGGG